MGTISSWNGRCIRSYSPRRCVQGRPGLDSVVHDVPPVFGRVTLFGATLLAHARRLCRSSPRVRWWPQGVSIFLPPRSMAQIVFVETLERLAGGWRIGTQPHSRARTRARRRNNNTPNAKLAIETPETHFHLLFHLLPPLLRLSMCFYSKRLKYRSTRFRYRHLSLPHILLWPWHLSHRRLFRACASQQYRPF
jgi:hypothetical protein